MAWRQDSGPEKRRNTPGSLRCSGTRLACSTEMFYASLDYDSANSLMRTGQFALLGVYFIALLRGLKTPGLIGAMLSVVTCIVPYGRKMLGVEKPTLDTWIGAAGVLSLAVIGVGFYGKEHAPVPMAGPVQTASAPAAPDWGAETRAQLEKDRATLESKRTALKPGDAVALQNYNALLKSYTERLGQYQEYLKTHVIPKSNVAAPLNAASAKAGGA